MKDWTDKEEDLQRELLTVSEEQQLQGESFKDRRTKEEVPQVRAVTSC